MEFEDHEVIVATAQLFVDALKHSFIKIPEINVLVIDECHHARENHPFHELMKQFQYVNPKDHPRIIGLSGMLVGIASKLKPETILDELNKLESTLNSKIVTVRKIQEYKNVLLYSTKPNEFFIKYPIDDYEDELVPAMKKKIDEIRWDLSLIKVPGMQEINPKSLNPVKSRRLREISLLFEDVKLEIDSMGLYAGYLGIKAMKVQLSLIRKKPDQKPQFLAAVNKCLDYAEELLGMMADYQFENAKSTDIYNNSTPKVQKLIQVLKTQFNDSSNVKDLQCLIFATQRSVTKCLYHLLKKFAKLEEDFPIKADFVVGINSEIPESIDEVSNASNNKDALVKFRKKEVNVIVTTSVLEEGIDLQMCNLVIMFDHPNTFRCYIQSKGRARVQNSKYIVFIKDKDAASFSSKRDTYDAIDGELKRILHSKVCDGEINQDDVDKEREELWEPFFTIERALVNNLSAVSLLNRYVSRYTNANGLFKRHDLGQNKVIAILAMPPSLGFNKPIISDPYPDIKTAKQSAAFKACHMLYEKGLLDKNLLPKK